MLRPHLGLPQLPGPVAGDGQHFLGPGREPAEEALVAPLAAGGGHEPFLRRLFAHAEAVADLPPGGSGPAGPIHEVADELVAEVAEPLGEPDRRPQPVDVVAFGLQPVDGLDEVFEIDAEIRRFHASTVD